MAPWTPAAKPATRSVSPAADRSWSLSGSPSMNSNSASRSPPSQHHHAPARVAWGPGYRQPQLGEHATQPQGELGPRGLDGARPAQLDEPPPAALIHHLVAPGRLPDGEEPHGAGSQPIVAPQCGGQRRLIQVWLDKHGSSCRRAPAHGRPTAYHRTSAPYPPTPPQHQPNANAPARPDQAFRNTLVRVEDLTNYGSAMPLSASHRA